MLFKSLQSISLKSSSNSNTSFGNVLLNGQNQSTNNVTFLDHTKALADSAKNKINAAMHNASFFWFIDIFLTKIDGYNKELRGLYKPYLLERAAKYLAVQEPYYVDMFSKLGYKGTCINCKTSTKYVLEKFICNKCIRLESREVRRAAKAEAKAKAKAKAEAEAEVEVEAEAEAEALKDQNNQIQK
ncbi:hypothetical protein ACTFIR_010458 [Dictyostelium discoideum]